MISNQGFQEPWPGFRAKIVKENGHGSDLVNRWFDESLQPRLKASPLVPEEPTQIIGEHASIAGTITAIGGLYVFGCYLQVITPAGVSSDWTLTVGWTYKGQAQTKAFPIVNTNTITTYEGETISMWVDAGTSISYTLAYNSNPAGAMVYDAAFWATLIQQTGA